MPHGEKANCDEVDPRELDPREVYLVDDALGRVAESRGQGTPRKDAQRFRLSPLRWCLLLSIVSVAIFGGCAGYRAGNASLYPPDIHTVYVPMFESDSFRRNLGERLTEAVMKDIETKTPYKVVSTPDADSVLTGRILGDTKRVVVQDRNDQPRDTEVNLVVQVSWLDRKGNLVSGRGDRTLPIPPSVVELNQSGELIPEYGQSGATAQQTAIERLAREIVALMEMPW